MLHLNMKKCTKKGHKMEDTWFGPYEVLRMSDTGSCSLYNMKTGTKVKQKVNASQLKLYVESAKKNDKETEAKTKDETHLAGYQNQVNVCKHALPVTTYAWFRNSIRYARKIKKSQSFNCAIAYFQRFPLAQIWSTCRGRLKVSSGATKKK